MPRRRSPGRARRSAVVSLSWRAIALASVSDAAAQSFAASDLAAFLAAAVSPPETLGFDAVSPGAIAPGSQIGPLSFAYDPVLFTLTIAGGRVHFLGVIDEAGFTHATLSSSPVDDLPFQVDDVILVDLALVPEPGAALQGAAAALVLACIRRRRARPPAVTENAR